MALEPKTKENEGSRYWMYLNSSNDKCPICGKQIDKSDNNIEYSRTKRSSHVFFIRNVLEKNKS